MQDAVYMARALALAKHGCFTTTPNPNVGCVIVRDGNIVGEGWHHKAGEPHAEVHALQMAGEKARGATAYVTLEPCSHFGRTPPCCDALIAAGVRRVIAAMKDPNPVVAGRGLARMAQAGIVVSDGLMAAEAEALNRGFLKRMRCGLPWVQLKLGASVDGRTAMASGESQWITSPCARRDVQQWRAKSSAILTSSATVLADDPALTVRWSELDEATQAVYPESSLRQPVRVIVDSAHRVTPRHRVIAPPGDVWLACLQPDSQCWPQTVQQLAVAGVPGQIDLAALLKTLAERQINHLWVEAGAVLAGALLTAGLVDELIIYLAPQLLGDNARGLCSLPGLTALADALVFNFSDIRQIGADLRLTLTPR